MREIGPIVATAIALVLYLGGIYALGRLRVTPSSKTARRRSRREEWTRRADGRTIGRTIGQTITNRRNTP